MLCLSKLKLVYGKKTFSKFKNKLILISCSSLTLLTSFLFYKKPKANRPENDSNLISQDSILKPQEIDFNLSYLKNKEPVYIEAPKIENLISLPKFQNVLILLKLAKLNPSKQIYSKCIKELEKLTFYGNSPSTDLSPHKPTDLITLKILKQKFIKADHNPFLNNGFANIISQLITDDLAIKLAYHAPHVDNRFFPNEPPGTVLKLLKLKPQKPAASIYTDPDFSLIFEFYNNFFKKIDSNLNHEMKSLFTKLETNYDSLLISEQIVYRPKQNIWSSNDSDYLLDDLDDENLNYFFEPNQNETKKKSLKLKQKIEIINKMEDLILKIMVKLVKINAKEFIRLGGFELLLLFYEKNKLNEKCLIQIGDCLTKLSLDETNRALFVRSGWLKRLNQMFCLKSDENLALLNQLISFKIIHNLNFVEPKYSTMLYPLDLEPVEEDKTSIDVIFIHGLRGSLFKSWRQDDSVKASNNSKNYSFCWPKDWLQFDLAKHKFRLLGINYESLYSLWGIEKLDDDQLKTSIKQRAIDLVEDLIQSGIGTRPVCFICHSMGGLIVKQLMVYLKEMENNEPFLKNIKSIVFLSTPHLGSSIARTITKFSFAVYPSTEVYELSIGNKFLLGLNEKFLDLIKDLDIKFLSLCENKPTYMGFNLYSKTVTENSARLPNIGEFYLLDDKDHLSICKAESRDCFIYKKILNLLNSIVQLSPDKQDTNFVQENFYYFLNFFN